MKYPTLVLYSYGIDRQGAEDLAKTDPEVNKEVPPVVVRLYLNEQSTLDVVRGMRFSNIVYMGFAEHHISAKAKKVLESYIV